MGQQIIIGWRQLSYANPDTADVDFIAQFPGQNRAGQIGDTPTGAAGFSLPAGASIEPSIQCHPGLERKDYRPIQLCVQYANVRLYMNVANTPKGKTGYSDRTIN
jgi:hypothetical protein